MVVKFVVIVMSVCLVFVGGVLVMVMKSIV